MLKIGPRSLTPDQYQLRRGDVNAFTAGVCEHLDPRSGTSLCVVVQYVTVASKRVGSGIRGATQGAAQALDNIRGPLQHFFYRRRFGLRQLAEKHRKTIV